MSGDARDHALKDWTPIIGPLSIWFAHFLIVYAAALIWPHQRTANVIAIVATVGALIALAVLFLRIRAQDPSNHQAQFAKHFGLGSIFIATAGTLFDAAPALFG